MAVAKTSMPKAVEGVVIPHSYKFHFDRDQIRFGLDFLVSMQKTNINNYI